MNLYRLISSSTHSTRSILASSCEISSYDRLHNPKNNIFFSKPNTYDVRKHVILHQERQYCARKATKCVAKATQEPSEIISKKQGSVAGAVALIVGTSIGSGMLALPKKTSPAGLFPSSISMTMCWAFFLVEALVLVELNVGLLKRKNSRVEDDGELEIISIRTMAQETLGELGGTLATLTYVFLGYTTIVAYIAKSGEILCHLINLPETVCGIFFTVLFTVLISVGGTKTTDQVNQWLTASMIGLLLAIEALAVAFGGWSGVGGSGNWERVPEAIPLLIFSLVHHELAPVLCAYLGGDLRRIRTSIVVGSFISLVAVLVWDAIALGLSAQHDQVVDPLELLMRVKWSGVSYMVTAFSLLAVGTSIIGTVLGFSEFFKEQINKVLSNSEPSANETPHSNPEKKKKLWGRNTISFAATAMAIAPSLLLSATLPDAFSAATDIAGGYCMTLLYGVLPPLMAWALRNREESESESESEDKAIDKGAVSRARPALVFVGLIACGIVLEQILEDFSLLHL